VCLIHRQVEREGGNISRSFTKEDVDEFIGCDLVQNHKIDTICQQRLTHVFPNQHVAIMYCAESVA
jgi:hypothetical protein